MKKIRFEEIKEQLKSNMRREILLEYVFFNVEDAIYIIHTLSDKQVKAIYEGLLTGNLKDDMIVLVTDWARKNGVKVDDVFN